MRQFNEAVLNGAGAGSRSIDTPYRAPSFLRQLVEFPQNLHLHLNEELLTGLVSHTWGYELGGRGSGTDVSYFASAVAMSDNSWTYLPGKTRSRTQTNISDPFSPPAPPKRPTMVPLPDFLRAKSSCKREQQNVCFLLAIGRDCGGTSAVPILRPADWRWFFCRTPVGCTRQWNAIRQGRSGSANFCDTGRSCRTMTLSRFDPVDVVHCKCQAAYHRSQAKEQWTKDDGTANSSVNSRVHL